MKRIVLLTILLAACFQVVKAQTEFAPIGATWYYSYADKENHNPLHSYVKYESLSDTIVGGHKCRLVASNSDTLFFYSENGKVYNYYKDHFLLTYDFSVSEGDTVSFDLRGYHNNFSIDTFYTVQGVVESVESIGNNNISRYSIKLALNDELKNEVASPYYFYTEKIGQEYRFISGLEYPSPGMDFGECDLRCYEDSLFHYTVDGWTHACDYNLSTSIQGHNGFEQIQLSPNPVYDILQVDNNCCLADCFNLTIKTTEGRTIIEQNIGQGLSNIEVSDLMPGMYCVFVSYDGILLTNHKIIKL